MEHQLRCGTPGCGKTLKTTAHPNYVISRVDDGGTRCKHCGARWAITEVGAPPKVKLPKGDGDPVGLSSSTERWMNDA